MSGVVQCPVCGVPVPEWHGNARENYLIECQRCGRYQISFEALQDIKSPPTARAAANASSYIRAEWPTDRMIKTADVDELWSVAAPSVAQRRMRLFRFLLARMESMGELIRIGKGDWELMGVSWSIDDEELAALLAQLEELGYFAEFGGKSSSTLCSYVVTGRGWDAYEQAGGTGVEYQQVFVAMWFDSEMDEACDVGIVPGIRSAGYEPLIVNRKQHVNVIYDEIIAGIRGSRAIVADLTGHRQGVYYEAGFARALGRTVILTCRADQIDPPGEVDPMKRVHFDQRHYNILAWSDPAQFAVDLAARIEAVLGRGPMS